MKRKEPSEGAQRIYADLRNVTSRISETTRFVGFGLLAVYYTLKVGEGALATQLSARFPCLLGVVGIAGAAAVLLDYLQYWCGVHSANVALRRDDFTYDKRSGWYKARERTFLAKQVAAITGALALVLMFILA
jgi:hypothetical protein